MHEGIKEVVKPFDWTYTTSYTGTIDDTVSILRQLSSTVSTSFCFPVFFIV